MITAAVIERTVAAKATGAFQEGAIAKSPSSEDITLHSKSAGASMESPSMAVISRAIRDMAACRA